MENQNQENQQHMNKSQLEHINNVAQHKKDLQLELPTDPEVLTKCLKNLYAGLNKANKNGAFDLQEAAQLQSDLSILTQLITQINKKVY
jgi:hypothetical protein